jgi:hypothetical protein
MHSSLGSLPKRRRPHCEAGQACSCNASGNRPRGQYIHGIGHYTRHYSQSGRRGTMTHDDGRLPAPSVGASPAKRPAGSPVPVLSTGLDSEVSYARACQCHRNVSGAAAAAAASNGESVLFADNGAILLYHGCGVRGITAGACGRSLRASAVASSSCPHFNLELSMHASAQLQ